MSLAQTYRNQAAQHQNRHLLLYILLAAGLHGIAGVALGFWQTHLRHALSKPLEPPTPIDFVYIEPSAKPVAPPANPAKRSQTNALAGSASADRPVQSSGQEPSGQARPSGHAQPSSPAQPSSQPVSPARSTQPSTGLLDAPARNPQTIPSPVRPAPVTPPVETAPSSTTRGVRSPAPVPAAPPPATPQTPAASDLYSLSVESGGSAAELGRNLTSNGLQGQLNPNRSGPGTGVDAAQDPWGGYLASLNRAIDQNWQRVSVSATSRTRIQFRVNQAGELFDLRLLETSGNPLADRAALQAVQAAAPFAPLPPNAEQVLIVNFTFTQWLGNDPP
ncbi:MAG: TonB family protein [Elainella sp.]